MLGVRHDMAFERLIDVVHAQEQMVLRGHAVGAVEMVIDAEQGDDVARPGLVDR
jgi:hypothetical protein